MKKIPKQHLKSMLYQNRICGFLPQVPPTLLSFSKKKTPYLIFFSSPLFSRTLPLFEPSQVTSLWIKTTRIQNSNQQSSLISPYPICLVHLESHTQLTPLTIYLVYMPRNCANIAIVKNVSLMCHQFKAHLQYMHQ